MSDPSTASVIGRLPRIAVVGALAALAALTLPGWLVVDIDQAWELVPDQVPDALLLAVDRGLSPHEMLGIGTMLAVLCIAAIACVVAVERGGQRGLLLIASLLMAAAFLVSLIILLLLYLTGVAVGTLLPDSWDRYDPDLRVAPWAPLFVLGTGGLAPWLLVLWIRNRDSASGPAGEHG